MPGVTPDDAAHIAAHIRYQLRLAGFEKSTRRSALRGGLPRWKRQRGGAVKVSELARSAGVTAETVRYCARIGLPAPPKDARLSADPGRLCIALRAKRLGFQLDEIAGIPGIRNAYSPRLIPRLPSD